MQSGDQFEGSEHCIKAKLFFVCFLLTQVRPLIAYLRKLSALMTASGLKAHTSRSLSVAWVRSSVRLLLMVFALFYPPGPQPLVHLDVYCHLSIDSRNISFLVSKASWLSLHCLHSIGLVLPWVLVWVGSASARSTKSCNAFWSSQPTVLIFHIYSELLWKSKL